MAGADEVFKAMRDPQLGQEAQRQGQQAAFEERVIKQLLRHARIELNVRAAKQQSWEGTQSSWISFAWFRENYPRFPVLLGTSKLRGTSGTQVGWTQLFGPGFMKLPWVQEYMRLCKAQGWDVQTQRIGLCFNVPHAPGASIMVLHNQPIQIEDATVTDPERRTEPETRVLRPFGPAGARVTYVFESLTSFLTTVGRDWVD